MANDANKNLRATIHVVLSDESRRTMETFQKMFGVGGASRGKGGGAGAVSSGMKDQATAAKELEKSLGGVATAGKAAAAALEKYNGSLDPSAKRVPKGSEVDAAHWRAQLEQRKRLMDFAKKQIAEFNKWESDQQRTQQALLNQKRRELGSAHREALADNRKFDRELAKQRKDAERAEALSKRGLSKTTTGGAAYWLGKKLDNAGLSGAGDTVRGLGAGYNWLYEKGEAVWGGLGKLRRGFLYFTVATAAFSMLIKPLDRIVGQLGQIGTNGVRSLLAIGKSAITSAGEMEYLRFRTDAVFGKQGRANFEWLSSFTVGMPFDIAQLGDAFNMLGVYGVQSLVNIKTAMVSVTDTAAALNRAPIDVAQAIGLGAKGAPGGMRRLRQFGITPAEIYGAGGVPGKNQAGLDPAHAAQNATAILTVLQAKFGGVASKMSNTWAQIVNDMGDMWKRFTLAVSGTEGFRFLEGTLSALRAKFMEFDQSGQLGKWAEQFAGVFMSVKPVVEFIAARLPSALQISLNYVSELGKRFEKFVGGKQGGVGGVFDGVLVGISKLIPLFATLANFYIDIKFTSLEMITVLGEAVAWVNLMSSKLPGNTEKERKDAKAYFEQSKALYGKFSGSGTWRQAGHDFINGMAADAQKVIGQLRGVGGDSSITAAQQSFNNELGRTFKQGGEDLADGIEQGVSRAQNFLSGASSLDVMSMLRYMRNGMSADQAAKAVQDANKLRGAYAKEGMLGGVTFSGGMSVAGMTGVGAGSPFADATGKFSDSVDKFSDAVSGGDGECYSGGGGYSSTTTSGGGGVGGRWVRGAKGMRWISAADDVQLTQHQQYVEAASKAAMSQDPTLGAYGFHGSGSADASPTGSGGGGGQSWWAKAAPWAIGLGVPPLGLKMGWDVLKSKLDPGHTAIWLRAWRLGRNRFRAGRGGAYTPEVPYGGIPGQGGVGGGAEAASGASRGYYESLGMRMQRLINGETTNVASRGAGFWGKAEGAMGAAGKLVGRALPWVGLGAEAGMGIYNTYQNHQRGMGWGESAARGLPWYSDPIGENFVKPYVLDKMYGNGGVTINFNGPVTNSEQVEQAVRNGLSSQVRRQSTAPAH